MFTVFATFIILTGSSARKLKRGTGNLLGGRARTRHQIMVYGRMTVTVPQNFLDKAVYPVIIDPTFGYATIGNSEDRTNNS